MDNSPAQPLLISLENSASGLEERVSRLSSLLGDLHGRIFGPASEPPSSIGIGLPKDVTTAEAALRLRMERVSDYLNRAESFAEQLHGRL